MSCKCQATTYDAHLSAVEQGYPPHVYRGRVSGGMSQAVAAALVADLDLFTEPALCDCGAAAVGSDAHWAECAVALEVLSVL